MEEPKIYLNICYNDKVVKPLTRQLELADPTNDQEWHIIPMAFTEPQYGKTIDGLQCIYYDTHVNTCVVEKMREGNRTFKAIMNYVWLKL